MTFPAFAAENVQGGDNSVTTKDVVVQADRAKEEAKWESQSTTIITAEDIEKKQAKSLEDVIFSETGVTRTVDAMGRVGIAIRGADPRHTLMLIDGQPVMGSESKFMGNSDEAMRIGAENIERIEIIRGAATAKYGPDAIGGVVNIITKAPSDHPSFQLNAEARYHKHDGTDENKNTWPSNWYMRADSGQVGNAKFSVWGSKRDILPVYSDERSYKKGSTWYFEDFRPSLRYYGDMKTIGASGEIELNDENKIAFRVMNEKEDLQRRNKSGEAGLESLFEPMQIFDRNMNRDTYAFTYTGRHGKADWKLDIDYGKMKETDVTKTTYYGSGHDQYGGKNTLASVDWLEHKQLDVNATLNVAANDEHFLTYGVGYTDERANGTRLKNAPKQWTKSIDPWDYDKSLWVPQGETEPDSNVHNYLFKQDENGLVWDKATEYYGGDTPVFTYEDAQAIKPVLKYIQSGDIDAIGRDIPAIGWTGDTALQERFEAFNELLKNANDLSDAYAIYKALPVLGYYGIGVYGQDTNIKYNDKYYGENFAERDNQVSGGEARIQRRHAYIQDTWQVNDNTILTPVIRVDDSDLFGSEITANLGLVHNLGGNPHRRLKVNAGTGYAEPGMGELYYNWEMYGSSGGSRYGWYWIGNPNLKPEKSVNFDISLEAESKKTFSRFTVFHNTIDDYMTSYFLGQLIDFNQFGSSTVTNADRIYSYKNIGKAKITGIEAEVQQKFNDHWSAKLGYAWLHAINDSDPDMPRQLLDRPQHKVDISLNFEDKASGIRAAIWGDYYIHMLDSNSVNTNNLYEQDSNGNYLRKKAEYKKKTFGIWNIMVQKDFGKDMSAYIGIDNLFNHRDDDRAYQDRLYRIGANIKFGWDGKEDAEKAKPVTANAVGTSENGEPAAADNTTSGEGTDTAITAQKTGDWMLDRPSDKDAGRKAGDVDLIGDYRVRSNMFHGQDNAYMTFSSNTSADDGAAKNYQDTPGHGLEQRLRLGVDYQIGDDTNFLIQGSSGDSIDTRYNKADKRGLHDVRLDRAELTQKANKWDFTIGRLTERMGATGYWFGKEYDGIRATWTGDKTQVRIGYGDFSASTGITDSAYTHTETNLYYRSATLGELLGYYLGMGTNAGEAVAYPDTVESDAYKTQAINYIEKFNHAGDGETDEYTIALKRLQVLQELNTYLVSVAESYPNDPEQGTYGGDWYMNTFLTSTEANRKGYGGTNCVYPRNTRAVGFRWIYGADNTSVDVLALRKAGYVFDDVSWSEMLDTENGLDNINRFLGSVYDAAIARKGADFFGSMTKDEAVKYLFTQFAGVNDGGVTYTASGKVLEPTNNGLLNNFFYILRNSNYNPTGDTDIPIGSLPASMRVLGNLLMQDYVPAIDRAAFIQVRQKLSDDFGLTAWYLRSTGDGYHKTGLYGSGTDMSGWSSYNQEMDIANVFGLGAQYRMGKSMLSFDWGINRSDTGRYLHGGRDAYGRYTGGGSAPTFWVLRADIGHSDTDVPGSWNAFADYKYFEHGSFFGGNGTEALPDRYLDGIRSFTLGAGYVPAKNFLLEAFYTFGAKSTQRRDTLHGSEDFTLGDYTRVQVSYKF